ncbi:Potassium transporter 7 [Bienertia sinuspersici]
MLRWKGKPGRFGSVATTLNKLKLKTQIVAISINEEASFGSRKRHVLLLAYQSLGIVYGDLSLSPLYVYESTLSGSLHQYVTEDVIFGVLSLIIWSLTLFSLIKYVIIMPSTNDNGEGGTLALYSLLRRYAKFSLLPNYQAADEELQAYHRPGYVTRSFPFRAFLQKHKRCRACLLLVVLFAACMVISGGVLTPALLGTVVTIVCIVLVGLFALQHRGTHKVSFLFAPIIISWLLSIAALGIYNSIKWNSHIYHALSPYYIYKFFKETPKVGWTSIGGLLLCITGSEAMFVDLGYFSTASLRVSFSCLVYPCLILQYMGQAAFLSKNNSSVASPFYSSIPGLACMIVTLVNTWLLSLVIIFVWYQNIVFALLPLLLFTPIELFYLSSSLVKMSRGGWASLVLAVLFVFIMYVWHYGSRRKYLLEVQNKVQMRWILGLGPNLGVLRVPGITLIYTELVSGVPAILTHFLTDLPAIHQVVVFVCIKYVPVPHVSDKQRYLVGRVGPKSFRMYRCIIRYGYKDIDKYVDDFEDNLVMSIAEFIRMEAEGARSSEGSMAVVRTSDKFGTRLVASDISISQTDEGSKSIHRRSSSQLGKSSAVHSLHSSYELEESPNSVRGVPELLEAKEAGVAYVVGHSYIKARRNSSKLKRFMINYAYSFLRKNCRSSAVDLHIPHISLIEVGVVYYL